MSTPLKVVEKNVHEVQVDNQALIFHVPSSALFAADSVTQAVLGKLREASMATEELANALTMFPRQTVTTTVNELLALRSEERRVGREGRYLRRPAGYPRTPHRK